MVQANELRIGNLVSSIHGYQRITAIDGDMFTINPFRGVEQSSFPGLKNGIEPIPITPEILEKCGFEVQYGKDIDKRFMESRTIAEKNNSRIMFEYNGRLSFINISGLEFKKHIPVKNLHQLQNLYFALTGEELICTL